MTDQALSGPFRPDRVRAAKVILRVAWETDRVRTMAALGMSILQALLVSSVALWLKLVVDSAGGAQWWATAGPALGLAVAIVGGAALDYGGSRTRQTLNEKAHHAMEQRLLKVVGRSPTLEIHENPHHLTQLELLDSESWEFGETIPAMLNVVNIAIRIATAAMLLGSVDPLLLLVPLFGVPSLALGGRVHRLYERGVEAAADLNRQSRDLYEMAMKPGPAKEIRVSRLQDEFVGRFRSAYRDRRVIEVRHLGRGQVLSLAGRLFFVLGYAGAIALMAARAVAGTATAGDVLLTAVLAGQVLGLVVGTTEVVQWALRTLTSASRYVYLLDVARRDRQAVADPLPVPDRLRTGISLEGVSYRYTGRNDREVLRDLDVFLPAGKSVAIVGDNGAGKSTFVKLLAGMYRPTGGRIRIDGVDLSRFDLERWRLRIAAAFQDHAHFELLLHETVGIGDLGQLGDREAAQAALDLAGASDVPATLPAGLDTQLGPAWPGGVDLSGGQWQKLAIGRAMMRRGPLLLILDEPAAALDAETEHLLFEQWTRAARRSAMDAGTITVLVSHRFSTVRMADLIIVLDRGRIAEFGSHEELIAAHGLYAELYRIQEISYR
ncbi:ABC transporter ATP-binding protein [Nonomuraea angiospora]|uniref:ABC transporter ATP-binding protein n=1 Tax=Nonomuraea angiospora TaxID=46172 RepID=UPI0029BDE468|nr:ABC transporter ATP-binding protein [Nonomuraea angiospora]MDX3103360.1 ABC transporter ATP-binding protein [Nonomuraea angiospora]